jgi:hypothetical protein
VGKVKAKEQTKYDVLNDLLGAYGRAAITAGQFWGQMKERGWGQTDIDEFCTEHHKREREKDDEREKNRAQGSATASAARGEGGQEHGRHPESARAQEQEQGQEDNGDVPEEERKGTVSGEVLIDLLPQEIDWVDRVSYAQTIARWEEDAQAQGGQPNDLDVRIAEGRLGGRGEAAVRKWIGKRIKWRILEPLEPGKRKPDFGDNIDVKTVHYKRAQLWLTENCPPEYIYILVSANLHPRYRIIGWCYGKEMMLQEHWNEGAPRKPAWVINQDNRILKSPATLYEMVMESAQ